MPISRRIALTAPGAAEPDQIDATFEDEEWKRFIEYGEECQRLNDSGVFDNFRAPIVLSGKQGQVVESKCQVPSDDAIAIILHRLRPFILQKKEPLSFYPMCNTLKQRIRHPVLHSLVEYFHDIFSGKDFRAYVTITHGSEVLNSDNRLMEWLNAHEYHRNQATKAAIAALFAELPTNLAKSVFCQMLMDKANAILAIGQLLANLRIACGTIASVPQKDGQIAHIAISQPSTS
ncbi:MAG: hypothetical protein WD648_00555 [Planctomycetaceae bacterium]